MQALKLRSKQLRKCLYEHDESIKETLPAKNTDDDLEHELAYTQSLVDKVAEDEILINIPKIKERLNMLKETLDDIQDHYTTSKDKDARVGHKTRDELARDIGQSWNNGSITKTQGCMFVRQGIWLYVKPDKERKGIKIKH